MLFPFVKRAEKHEFHSSRMQMGSDIMLFPFVKRVDKHEFHSSRMLFKDANGKRHMLFPFVKRWKNKSFILQRCKWEATYVISLCNKGGKTKVSFFKKANGKLHMLFPFVTKVEKHEFHSPRRQMGSDMCYFPL